MQPLWQYLRYAVRMSTKKPYFTWIIVIYAGARRRRVLGRLQRSQHAAVKANTGGHYRQPVTQINRRQDVSRSLAARRDGKVLAIATRLRAAASGG
jgi:hypothetical protein